MATIVTVGVVVVAAVVVAVMFWRSGGDGQDVAGPAWTTATVPAEVPAETTAATTSAPAQEPVPSGSGSLACDGRGVLIVSSVMANSPTFQQEIDGALASSPAAVELEPGHCPSLRATVDDVDVHPVVIDYGDDIAGLCRAAASAPGTNARLLNDDTSYSSPC